MKNYSLLILIGGGIFLTLGDIFLKKWSIGSSVLLYVVSMILYIIGLSFFAVTLKENNLAIASSILLTANTVTLILVSYFYFHEKFTLLESLGLLLSVIAVILMEWE